MKTLSMFKFHNNNEQMFQIICRKKELSKTDLMNSHCHQFGFSLTFNHTKERLHARVMQKSLLFSLLTQ